MQEHLADRAKTEVRVIWFLKRTEKLILWMNSILVFFLFVTFLLLICLRLM